MLNKIPLIAVVFWACGLITHVVLEATDRLTQLTSTDVTFVGGVIGILATTIGLYQWSKERRDGSKT